MKVKPLNWLWAMGYCWVADTATHRYVAFRDEGSVSRNNVGGEPIKWTAESEDDAKAKCQKHRDEYVMTMIEDDPAPTEEQIIGFGKRNNLPGGLADWSRLVDDARSLHNAP
jgi:hypothetical protein